jgi:hypothetical protein
MHKLTINEEDGTTHIYECANGFVSRCVAAVHAANYADARRVCEILNREAEQRRGVARILK